MRAIKNYLIAAGKSSLLAKVLFLKIPLVVVLYLIRDADDNLAFASALESNEPGLRVFRGLSEIVLALFCAAASLKIFRVVIGAELLGELLFSPAFDEPRTVFDYAEDENDVELVPIDGTRVEEGLRVGSSSDGAKDEEELIKESPDDSYSDGNSECSSATPATAEELIHTSVNLFLMVLVSILLFALSSVSTVTEEGVPDRSFSSIAAPVFPLLLFFVMIFLAFHPWGKRKSFWNVVLRTIEAPYYDVTFRDGFIGDILTSSVRPLQDIAFTLFYVFSCLQGWWSSKYTLEEAAVPEHSWLVYTVILPMCMISPLWYRFAQTLRQAFDNKRRWPYLGNSLKYFFAAQVAIFGVFFPASKESTIWISCFVIATLYQVAWDTFMDWELLIFDGSTIALRKRRLYKYKSFYALIFVVNFMLRFCWTMSFIPPETLSSAGVLVKTFSGDLNFALASAEIIRRALWGLLRVEVEALKQADQKISQCETLMSTNDDMHPMRVNPTTTASSSYPSISALKYSDMSESSDVYIMGELCLYATAFMGLGIVAAAHKT